MADIVKYYINNQEYNPPKDWQDTTLELSFEEDTQKQQVSFSDVTFVRENSTLIQDFISQYGVFVAIPFKKTVNSSVVFDGFISTSNDLRVSPMETSLKIIEKDCKSSHVFAEDDGTLTFHKDLSMPDGIGHPIDLGLIDDYGLQIVAGSDEEFVIKMRE
jgi:hypothetical protein